MNKLRSHVFPVVCLAWALAACSASDESGPASNANGGADASGGSGDTGGSNNGQGQGGESLAGSGGKPPVGGVGGGTGGGAGGADDNGGAPNNGGTQNAGGTPNAGGSQNVGGAANGPDPDCIKMVDAAKAFVATLDPTLKDELSYPWADAQRQRFEFVPPQNSPRGGLTMKKLSAPQLAALDAFLRSAMSSPGHMKAEAIRQLEVVLGAPPYRDPINYFVSFFGEPSADSEMPWGWRFEGHHLSVHASVVACEQFAATPAFWGFSGVGGAVQNPMGDVPAAAKALFDSLTPEQKTAAGDGDDGGIKGNNTKQAPITPYEPAGVVAAMLNADQQTKLRALINTYVGMMAKPIADNRLKAIEDAGLGEVRFLYLGDYFRLQGPTFLIEYETPDPGHVHSVWREFDGDWGEDLLQQHLNQMHQPMP